MSRWAPAASDARPSFAPTNRPHWRVLGLLRDGSCSPRDLPRAGLSDTLEDMIGRPIASGVIAFREMHARVLVRMGVGPDTLTCAGAISTTAVAVCLAFGTRSRFAWSLTPGAPANAYLLLAGVAMYMACASDMLDGAVARLGGKASRFGAFLDSTLDRYSDFAVYAGIAASYAWQSPANITFVLLCMVATFNCFMISYAKARAEDFIDSCGVGFWQRGERSAAILIATFAHNIPALVVQQAALPMFTVLRRIAHTRALLQGRKDPSDPDNYSTMQKLCFWRRQRMTLWYDITVALNIAWLILARIEPTDWIRILIESPR